MKTMENTMNKTNFKMTSENFKNEIKEFLNRLEKFTNFMDYKITGNDPNFKEINKLSIHLLSLNQKKKLRNLLIKANYKMSLKSINKFLHFLYKNILKSDKRVNIKISDKENIIQKNRIEWIKARDNANTALSIYKKSKKNFYKIKNEKIKIAKML